MTRLFLVVASAALLGAVAACGDTQGPPVDNRSLLPDSAEQLMIGTGFTLTDAGVRRATVQADSLLMYDDASRNELRKVTARFYSIAGEQEAILTSEQGTHSSRLGTMEARGNVVIVSREGKQLHSPHLKYDPTRNEISSDSAFTLTEGERVTKGVGFVSNPDMTNMRILAGAQSTGTEVRIPRK
jgi:LPS export ABC transporter protein LptC